jgi:hypothetical protein
MKRGSAYFAAALAAPAVQAAPAAAQAPPPAPAVVLGAHLYPKPYGLTYTYGRLEVPDGTAPGAVANQTVVLYSSGFPFSSWTAVATLTTDWEGYFTYHQTIGQNTEFRAVWQAGAPVQSKDRLVKLPLRVSLKASVSGGRFVTFSGKGYPSHPGGRVLVQRLDAHGHFRNVTSAVLGPASTYKRRWRLRGGGGVFRALIPGDGQFGAGASRLIRLR